MTGKCNIILVYDEHDKNKRWLTRLDFVRNTHYRYLIQFGRRMLPSVNEILPLFENDYNIDNKLGILPSDKITKINIYDYLKLSSILKESSYKFNKKNQKLIKK